MDDPVVEVEHESKSAVTVDTGTASTELPTTTIAIGDIVIGKRFRRTLGRLETLVCSIREVGLLHPIVVTADRRLVAGQRRLEACRTLGWTEIPVRVVDLEDLLRAEHDENTVRKDFTPSEAVAIARAWKERERERAKANQKAGLKRGTARAGKLPEREKGRTRDRIAKRVGLSGRTLAKAEAVVKAAEADPDKCQPLVDVMDRTGKVDRAHRGLQALSPLSSAASTPPSPTPTTSAPTPSSPTAPRKKVPGMVTKLYEALDSVQKRIDEVEEGIGEVPVTARGGLRRRIGVALKRLDGLLAALGPAAA